MTAREEFAKGAARHQLIDFVAYCAGTILATAGAFVLWGPGAALITFGIGVAVWSLDSTHCQASRSIAD